MDVAPIVTPNVVKDTQICTSNLLVVPTNIPERIPEYSAPNREGTAYISPQLNNGSAT